MKAKFLSSLFLLLLISCTTQDVCDDIIQHEMVLRFKTNEQGTTKDTLLSGLTVYGIREGRPDSLLNVLSPASRITLPLDSHHDFSRFVWTMNDRNDTLRIIHTAEFYMYSYQCGFTTLFNVEDVNYDSSGMIKDHEIKIELVESELEPNEEHLWIYF